MAELSPARRPPLPAAPRPPARRPRYPRRLRRAVPALVLIAVLAALAGGVWWRVLQRVEADAAAGCQAAMLDPHAVRLRVYNASAREGLARSVAGQLVRRGFVVVGTANDPLMDLRPITTGWAEIRYGPAGTSNARLLAAHVPAAKLIPDGRRDAVVDVVLGPGFKRLSNAAEQARALAALRAAASAAASPAARAGAAGTDPAGRAEPRQGIVAATTAAGGAATAPRPTC